MNVTAIVLAFYLFVIDSSLHTVIYTFQIYLKIECLQEISHEGASMGVQLFILQILVHQKIYGFEPNMERYEGQAERRTK